MIAQPKLPIKIDTLMNAIHADCQRVDRMQKPESVRFFIDFHPEAQNDNEYESEDDLINSSPTRYIKTSSGCLLMKGTDTILVFTAPQTTSPSHLEMVKSTEPLTTERLGEMDLAKIAIEKRGP